MISHSDDQVVVSCCDVRVHMLDELGRKICDALPYF
jgi:hypothetical protein